MSAVTLQSKSAAATVTLSSRSNQIPVASPIGPGWFLYLTYATGAWAFAPKSSTATVTLLTKN